jgi:site-specific DNA-methyltransferase (adenine-specific)
MTLPAPYYQDGSCTIYNADCREILPLLEPVDLVLTDPPYGMSYKPASVHVNAINFDSVVGDAEVFDPCFLLGKGRLVLWGANYYASKLPDCGGWIGWDKRLISGMKVRSSEAEFAWTNFIRSPKIYRHLWAGAFRDGEGRGQHLHPTQKPMELMRWCIEQADKHGLSQTILDPFMGSGTTLVAAKNLGRKAIGIEIEEKYCAIAVKRLRQEVLPLC